MPTLDQDKSLQRVHRAIEAIQNEGMVIMVDEEDRENEGDIVFAADHVSPEKINFMSKEARGLICLAMEPEKIERLQLPMMLDNSKSSAALETAFTVSIEAREGVTTGISAQDRAKTVQVAASPNARPDDIVVPGHIFPLRAKAGGVLERAGHTEGSVDLAKLAGLGGAAVICEIMKDDGSMARLPDLERLAERFDLPIVTIPDLINYRLLQDSLVKVMHRFPYKCEAGVFDSVLFESQVDGCRHLAFMKGAPFTDRVVDVRVHAQRSLVDIFGDGRQRIDYGFEMLQRVEHGVFLYLTRPVGQQFFSDEYIEVVGGAGSVDQGSSAPAVTMDRRHIGLGAQILRSLGVQRMAVHTSSAKPYLGLSGFGLEVVDSVELGAPRV